MKYYVFDDEATAVAAEAAICQIAGAPRVGYNAKTGLPAPDKCKTERWAIPRRRNDGKWVFPYVGDEVLADYPSETIDGFNTQFPYVFEEYDQSWFEEESSSSSGE
jgi:hypothetical protein